MTDKDLSLVTQLDSVIDKLKDVRRDVDAIKTFVDDFYDENPKDLHPHPSGGLIPRETLRRIAQWKLNSRKDYEELFEGVRKLWVSMDGIGVVKQPQDGTYVFWTGYLNDNEMLISALMSNEEVKLSAWFSTQRGGYTTFHLPGDLDISSSP